MGLTRKKSAAHQNVKTAARKSRKRNIQLQGGEEQFRAERERARNPIKPPRRRAA